MAGGWGRLGLPLVTAVLAATLHASVYRSPPIERRQMKEQYGLDCL